NYKQDQIIPEASWDRIAERTVELKRIRAADARRILEARLERFHYPFLEVDEIRLQLQTDTLYPLGRAWLDKRLRDGLELRTRDILSWAREAWEDQRRALERLGGATWLAACPQTVGGEDDDGPDGKIDELIDAAVDRKIEEQIALHRLQPGGLPPDAGNLA